MFPEQKGNSREPLPFAVGTGPLVSWGPGIKISVLTSFFHGRNVASREKQVLPVEDAEPSAPYASKLFNLGSGRIDPLSQSGIIPGVEVNKQVLKDRGAKTISIECCI